MRISLPFTALWLAAAAAVLAQAPTPDPLAPFVKENYTKYEYRVPMRDGVKLFTSVYIPKEVFSDGKTYPIMFDRTPYSVGPYGPDAYRDSLGPSELFTREKFIFVYQDVRGRYMSEGAFVNIRPHNPHKGPKETDESTDTYDTIDWLVKNVPGATAKVGMWGISQPGFYTSAGMIDAHPALVAASPQAPVTDYYLGDDNFHNGAFMLAANFGFYLGFKPDPNPLLPPQRLPFQYGTPDGYEFYLGLGSIANIDEKYFQRKNPYWTQNVEHTIYDEVWESRSIWKHLKNIKPAVLTVGGWFDAEDLQGPLRTFYFMEKNSPPSAGNTLVMGPWTHGGFARGDGDRVGNVSFSSKTGVYYREKIEFAFFLQHLKGKGDGKFPKAWVFETGTDQWRKFDAWPPKSAQPKTLFLGAGGALGWTRPSMAAFDEYLSDPNKPVPYIGQIVMGMRRDYMTEDQRFASTRPDVLVYRSEVLDHDVTVFGPIGVDLKVSTSGTDSDFDVKLVDVYPGDYPEPGPPPNPRTEPANTIKMGGYEQLVRGEPFRGKFRKGFEKPVPFEAGKPDRITFQMPDVAHTFRRGHRIMVQVQSSWFPLTDRNPQKFMDIPHASPSDFVKATQRVYVGGADGSRITLLVAE